MASISADVFHYFFQEKDSVFDRYYFYFTDRSANSVTRTWVLKFNISDRSWDGFHWWEHVEVGVSHHAGPLPKKMTMALVTAAINAGVVVVRRG